MAIGPESVDVHVGERVRARRNLVGMSQETLGKSLGLTFQQVQKYEKGTNRISASKLHRIAGILRVSVGFFFEGLPDGETSVDKEADARAIAMARFASTAEGMRLNHAFPLIEDPLVRSSMLALVESVGGRSRKATGA